MTATVNTPTTLRLTFRDVADALVTGKTNSDFAKTAYLASDGTTTATVTVAAISGQSGKYSASFTPTVAGLWSVEVECTHSGQTYRWSEDVDVVTAAQADPAASLLSGTIHLVSPVLGNGTARVIRGDDYLTAIGRSLSWTIEDQTLPGDAALTFTIYQHDNTVALTKAMTVTDAGPPDAVVTVDLTHTESAALPKGSLRCAIVMTRDTDKVVTLMRGEIGIEVVP